VSLAGMVDRLGVAALAARDLGLPDEAAVAEELLRRIEQRIGFVGDVYVLALAGGTGVGKSSVLNALAGETVSRVGAVRPITEQPLAWVKGNQRHELSPLLEWLGVDQVVGHDRPDLVRVAILDLPDVDSVRAEHRARVDALLPLIDAVAWVVDPEKYDDERLHSYLRQLNEHSARMRFVFNKAERLNSEERRTLVQDLSRRLIEDGINRVPIHTVSAASGLGIEALRAELSHAADAKAIVAAKLATDAGMAINRLAIAAGLAPGAGYRTLLSDAERAAATRQAVEGALTIVDPAGMTEQLDAAVLHRARRRGGSLLARFVELLTLVTGHRRRKADPAAYLLDWRRRGSMGHILNPVRSSMVKAAAGVSPNFRPSILSTLGSETAEVAVTQALDQSTRRAASGLEIRGSIFWTLIGVIQLAVGAVFAFAVVWYVMIIFGPTGLGVRTVDLPYLGPIPMPLLLLAGALLASGVLSVLLTIHARWTSRRLGLRVAMEVRKAVEEKIAEVGFAGLDRVEQARRRLAEAAAE